MSQFKPCPKCGSLAVEIGISKEGHYEGYARSIDWVGSLTYKCNSCEHKWRENDE